MSRAWHVLLALFAYLVGYNMTWSATNKDLQDSTVFKEIPLAFKRFWLVWLIMGVYLAAVVVLSTCKHAHITARHLLRRTAALIPLEWRITDAIIFPGCLLASMHILYRKHLTITFVTFADLLAAILLNPFIVLFNFRSSSSQVLFCSVSGYKG